MRILYAGDSPVGGPANYLLAVLRFLKADFIHVPPNEKLSKSLFQRNRFDGIILSDFSRKHVSDSTEQAIADQVKKGTGLLMVGGWASFSGPFGGWHGSKVEEILPVTCLNRDDRLNFPGGAWILQKRKHPLLSSISFKNPPVICGLNQVKVKKGSTVLLSARKIKAQGTKLSLSSLERPLLVISQNPAQRTVALTTDLAPHWCGGLVDWGSRRIRLRARKKIWVEVGNLYLGFVTSLLTWLIGEQWEPGELEVLDRLHEGERKKGWIQLKTAQDIESLLCND